MNVDAVSLIATDVVLSFDTTVALAGGVVAADEDLVSLDGVSYSLLFDGSALGIDPALDLDGASVGASGELLVSFDSGGTVGGVTFDDDTVLRRSSGGAWSIAFDVGSAHAGFGGADVVAVPESGVTLSVLAGGWMLLAAARTRQGRSSARNM